MLLLSIGIPHICQMQPQCAPRQSVATGARAAEAVPAMVAKEVVAKRRRWTARPPAWEYRGVQARKGGGGTEDGEYGGLPRAYLPWSLNPVRDESFLRPLLTPYLDGVCTARKDQRRLLSTRYEQFLRGAERPMVGWKSQRRAVPKVGCLRKISR